jgi:hypothetical protein
VLDLLPTKVSGERPDFFFPLYRKLVEHGYRANELVIDALCYLPSAV